MKLVKFMASFFFLGLTYSAMAIPVDLYCHCKPFPYKIGNTCSCGLDEPKPIGRTDLGWPEKKRKSAASKQADGSFYVKHGRNLTIRCPKNYILSHYEFNNRSPKTEGGHLSYLQCKKRIWVAHDGYLKTIRCRLNSMPYTVGY